MSNIRERAEWKDQPRLGTFCKASSYDAMRRAAGTGFAVPRRVDRVLLLVWSNGHRGGPWCTAAMHGIRGSGTTPHRALLL
jgi:hypothetical protein